VQGIKQRGHLDENAWRDVFGRLAQSEESFNTFCQREGLNTSSFPDRARSMSRCHPLARVSLQTWNVALGTTLRFGAVCRLQNVAAITAIAPQWGSANTDRDGHLVLLLRSSTCCGAGRAAAVLTLSWLDLAPTNFPNSHDLKSSPNLCECGVWPSRPACDASLPPVTVALLHPWLLPSERTPSVSSGCSPSDPHNGPKRSSFQRSFRGCRRAAPLQCRR